MKNKTVYVVHAVDTEGPLYESIRANFERIHELFGHKIEPNIENLRKLQNKKINLNGDEDRVQRILSSKRIDTHENWGQINLMLDLITSDKFRDELKDSFDGGWIFNWFCMCHVGITGENPRRRDIGYHNIYDYYREYFDKNNDNRDLIQWHYHALSLTNDANRAGSTYLNSNHIYNIISRMIIDRSFFPSVFRAGHVTERPDSHFFLEQWIPFDYSNSSHPDNSDSTSSPARFGNWLRAPVSWIPYHPGHDDYQIPGTCRRFIARCLPMDERAYSIKYDDVKKAYDEADKYGTSILSFTNHDFRNMAPDIIKVRELIKDCDQKYPNVKFKYSNAIDAMRAVSNVTNSKKIGFDVVLKKYKSHVRMIVEATNDIFGPQPYLALKTKNNDYVWQNFDFEGKNKWSYSFDAHNIYIDNIDAIGIASNTSCGLTEIININPETGNQKKSILNN